MRILAATLAAAAAVSVTLATATESKLRMQLKQFEFPIAGSIERVKLEATKGKFLHSKMSAQAYFFTQRVDHFSATDKRTFSQRFYLYEPEYIDPSAPIFLYVGGNHPLTDIPEDDVRLLAKEYACPILALEHRYYGASLPVPDLSYDNLQYLRTSQALADIADFRAFFQNVYNQLHGFRAGSEHRWFTFGVGYGGAMAAWFRLKYPHLTKGTIASSATVVAKADFKFFDMQTAVTLGDDCARLVRESLNGVISLAASDISRTHIDTILKKGHLSMEDLVLYLADAVSLPAVYGRHQDMCDIFIGNDKAGKSTLQSLKDHLESSFDSIYARNNTADWELTSLKDTTHNATTNARQVWYQKCTELGNFETSGGERGVRPSMLDAQFYHTRCRLIFGRTLWPDVDETNRNYGDANIAASHIFFTNGVQDPWLHASVTHSVRPSEPAMVISCANCAHGVDLRGCPSGPWGTNYEKPGICQDQNTILNARKATQHFISAWLNEP